MSVNFILHPFQPHMAHLKKHLVFCIVLLIMISCTADHQNKKAHVPKVFIEKTAEGYQLIRNGNPFFIKGASGNTFFKELKEAGANTLRIYDTVNLKQTLDSAEIVGLAVVVDIPIPRFVTPDTIFNNEATMAKLYDDTKRFVKIHKNHPALLYWMLGNEIAYPDLPGNRNLTKNFNALVDMIHEEDQNHPVSTAIGGFDRSKILSIQTLSSAIDLISINIFGELSTFEKRKSAISLIWDGPYVFSEFGINGPWEATKTLWGAPIEETSTKKAEQYKERYFNYVKTINDGRLLGCLNFYWGYKQERTHTWFTTLTEHKKKTQSAFEYENLWTEKNIKFDGPEINYILLNEKGAQESLILNPADKAIAKLLLVNEKLADQYTINWNIRPENWNYAYNEIEKKPEEIKGLILDQDRTHVDFLTPEQEGPYRLYVTVEDNNGYIATANVPFYILNPLNEFE